ARPRRGGAPPPPPPTALTVTLAAAPPPPAGPPPRRHTQDVLARVQERLRAQTATDGPLVFVTRHAMAVTGEETPDPAGAAIWGLVRAVLAEHPGQFALVDTDGTEESRAALRTLDVSGEPQSAVRGGVLHIPRLVVARATAAGRPKWDPRGTVLLTGATGALGELVARHLVTEHGVRNLLLLSRRGPQAPGAAELAQELTALGAAVTQAPCDVSDRAALAEQLARIPGTAPLTAVVHLAGVLDDAASDSMTPSQLDRVLGPKADAAWHLHELTAGTELSAFVLYSSVVGTLGNAGQANYAAANAFLDALAAGRKAAGLPALALAWGPWEVGMAGKLAETDLRRFRRNGMVPLSAKQGVDLFDAALARHEASLVPVVLDRTAIEQQDSPPVLLRGMVEPRAERVEEDAVPPVLKRLAGLDRADQVDELRALLLSTAAVVLGYPDADDIDADMSFQEIGFDSLSGVEFRNHVKQDTRIQIPPTVIYNYPTPAALAERLWELLFAPDAQDGEQRDDEDAAAEEAEEELDSMDAADLIERVFSE
ncbi:beta-ketoacyl reductase, partial [Streptomyces sp. NPDC058953]|uniref:type I polyketide synthase n=1 Tax=Streptomyces sp. NPDC058953 TaxID=3346676 RepID=UPI003699A985